MRPSPLLVICILTFVAQIVFSIYYSLTIVDQNTLLNSQLQQLTTLETNHRQLINTLASHNSLDTVFNYPESEILVPVTKSIDLK